MQSVPSAEFAVRRSVDRSPPALLASAGDLHADGGDLDGDAAEACSDQCRQAASMVVQGEMSRHDVRVDPDDDVVRQVVELVWLQELEGEALVVDERTLLGAEVLDAVAAHRLLDDIGDGLFHEPVFVRNLDAGHGSSFRCCGWQ